MLLLVVASPRYAMYGVVMCVLYVGGFPLGILYVLFKRRKGLFGPGSEATMRKYGFLYDAYGPVAWFWETEELMRKLMLTAVAVLMDAGSASVRTSAATVRCPSSCCCCASSLASRGCLR